MGISPITIPAQAALLSAGARALLASLADKVEKAMYLSEANHEIWPEKLQRMRKVFERA